MLLWFLLGLLIGLIIGAVMLVLGRKSGLQEGHQLGYEERKRVAEAAISSAEEEARRLIEDAKKKGESKRKEIVLKGKEEVYALKSENEKEMRERRGEMNKQEKRLQQREEHLNKKIEQAEKKLEQAAARVKQADEKYAEAEEIRRSQLETLEKLSGLTSEQAKDLLLEALDDELIHEKAVKIKDYEQQTRDEAEKRAKNIIALAIQRCASDYVAETTVSVVPLPNDEMKGRIIGREGRNIRALETATGVDIIIDDTPEAITLSCFNPIRREVARIAMLRLIGDGRIHPTRIEEMVEKANREVEAFIKEEGEKAMLEANVMGLHPELVKLLGRLRYRTSYGQNVLRHSLEVSMIAGAMAAELGADVTAARRAGLLHDIGKALDYEMEGSHVDIGVDVARKYREQEHIIHAIAAHHGGVEATSITDCLVQAADAVSAARPGARRENVESYIKRLQRLEEIASGFAGVSETFAIQAGREVRVIVKPEAIGDADMPFLAREICKKIESELDYPGQIKVNVIRESRASEYAK
ncbi:MAG: ribonuclease Y [Clostridia bacterium]|nr:ribonuclease Y [Clostridia bacterium]